MRTKRTVLAALAAVATVSVPALRAAEPFYERRLEEGLRAYSRDEYSAAARDLEIACFGLLGEPVKLAACWTHLALAQAGGGDRQGFADTAGRLLDLEQRLEAYSRAAIDQEARRVFEERLREWMPGEDLRTVPASAAETPAPAVADEVDARLAAVHELLGFSRDRGELERTFAELRAIADRRPEHRELQKVVAEIGYRLRRWQDAVTYFQRGGVSGSEPPERQFYYAVALYETGDLRAAARVLELCLPRLQKTEYVRGVADRVLGREP